MPYQLSKDGLCVIRADTGATVKCHDSHEQAVAHLQALTINVTNKESAMPDEIMERAFTAEQRKEFAQKGWAMADGSYPIENKADLQNAIHAVGRGSGSHESIKAHIIKRAKALGATDLLPADWSGSSKEESVRATYFAELANLHESVLSSDDEYVARGVTLIKPGFSRNVDKAGRPRYYAPDMLKRDAMKFEGVRSYANHPSVTEARDRPERDIRDITGYFENVQASDDGTLKADYHIVGAARQWLWPLIKETQRKPDLVELSINALGETKIDKVEGREAVVIESIVKGNSVDNVTTAAAGGTFKGALLASDPDQWMSDLLEAMPFEQWRSAKPDYVQKLQAEWVTVRQTDALKAAEATTEAFRADLTALQEKYQVDQSELVQLRRAAMADRILESSGLPFDFRKETRAILLTLETEEAMKEAVERDVKRFKAAPKEKIAVDRGGQPVTTHVIDAKPQSLAVQLFGLKESHVPLPDETAEEYKARIRR